ncbi:hypothetical protein [Enterococcus caccae]|uniref:Lipoprotein n=1 Tax=Enterococcus caccae ATCC BAA-1240 TaxID=1158612 RepID=R3W7F8_9ENTE|nr:hypothetical protein [Enterococcus caccae]EOL43442.1 hypothetical protein UC7_02771 [Enterococcus caccae ATCC BAA-1240]EOT68158.1 hypothetical protein I580_00541 [Enterococcus caccae ATCC BAA-1240]
MKKGVIFLSLLTSLLLLSACGQSKKSQHDELIKNTETVLKGKVKIPETYFKTKEQVTAEFDSVGLKPKFVIANFDDAAQYNKRFLRKDECNQISSDQGAVNYYDTKSVGDKHGFYADKGATIIVGYSDHDFDGTQTEAHSTEESSSIKNEEGVTSQESQAQAFEATDVSDQTINSIKTYQDYLSMYQAIINNYFADYENMIKDTILYNQTSFEEQKKQYDASFEEQKKQYEKYGNKRLIGKDSLVDFLIGYRDSLKEITDNLAKSLQ